MGNITAMYMTMYANVLKKIFYQAKLKLVCC